MLQANFGQAFTQNLVKNAGGASNDSSGNKDDPVDVKKAGKVEFECSPRPRFMSNAASIHV